MKISAERSTKYMAHGSGTKELFFQYKVQYLMLVRTAVLKVGVKESTARAWWKNYEKKTNTQNRPKSQLQEEHKQCLIELYDDNTCAYIQDAVEVLTNKFAGLEIKKSRVHESMRDNCNLTFKKATFWSEARASSYTIQKHYD